MVKLTEDLRYLIVNYFDLICLIKILKLLQANEKREKTVWYRLLQLNMKENQILLKQRFGKFLLHTAAIDNELLFKDIKTDNIDLLDKPLAAYLLTLACY